MYIYIVSCFFTVLFRDISWSWVSRNLSDVSVGDGFPNTSLVVVEYGSNAGRFQSDALKLKTSPQAKRHKASLLVISLHFFSLLCLF